MGHPVAIRTTQTLAAGVRLVNPIMGPRKPGKGVHESGISL